MGRESGSEFVVVYILRGKRIEFFFFSLIKVNLVKLFGDIFSRDRSVTKS